jgi:WD40 repeat protein
MSASATPASPYKGLAAFADSELDALFFFGREREREVIVANMLASRLTILYGESGVGKSSLLAAGVVRELRERAPGAVVELHDSWSGADDDLLAGVAGAPEAYLILDQFEEYFLYHGDDDSPGRLLHDLPELLRDSRVNVLVSLREDSLSRLDAFKAEIPSVFSNQVRLDHLDRRAARSAIIGPIDRWNALTGDGITIEPGLVEAVLDEIADEGEPIEAPYLQLVLERIWNAERAAGSSVLRLSALRSLGGAATIVHDHLEVALESLDGSERDVASSMFEHLVTPSGTKIAHRAPDLADYANVPEDVLRRVLAVLTRERIVHSVDGSDRFEIFHDVLAEPIRAWRHERRLERERAAARRRQRRLYVFSAASLLALAIVAGLAVWALSERGSAQRQARHARARELEASALQQLTIDPHHSVKLAVSAVTREPSDSAEAVLRTALVADRLRLVRHAAGPVTAVAISADGALVAAAGTGGPVLVLDRVTGRVEHRLVVHGPLAWLAFAPDGQSLVGASPAGLAQVWSLPAGVPVTSSGPQFAARTPDGGLLLVPARGTLAKLGKRVELLSTDSRGSVLGAIVRDPDKHVHAWLFNRQGRRLRELAPIGITDIVFSPAKPLVATTSADGFTIVWNPRTGKRVWTLQDSKNGVVVAAFSPDGALLATGGKDSGVRVWTIATGERTFFLFAHSNPAETLAWSPDGRVLASGSPDKSIRLWRIQGLIGGGSLAATLAGDRGGIDALAFTPDSARLVSGGEDASIRVWYAVPDEELKLVGRAPGSAAVARWAGNTIAAAWTSGVVKTYDPQTLRLVHAFRSKLAVAYTSLALSRDGSVIAAGSADGVTDVWSADGSALHGLTGEHPVAAVAVAPGGKLVASIDVTGTVEVWDPQSGVLRWSGEQKGEGRDVAFSPNGRTLATAGASGAVLWSVANGRMLHALPSPKGDVKVAFSPNGRLLATAGGDTNGRLWFVGSGRVYRVLHRHTQPLTDVVFSRDGRVVATAAGDSDVRIWNVARGTGHVLDRSAFGPVPDIDFDSSGRWVVGAAPISAVIWRASSGAFLFYLRGHGPIVTSVAFAPRGPTVLTSSSDGTVRTYTCTVCVDRASLLRLAQERIKATR